MPNFSLIFFKLIPWQNLNTKKKKKSLEFVNKNSNNSDTKGENATFDEVCSLVKRMVFIYTILTERENCWLLVLQYMTVIYQLYNTVPELLN